MTFMFHNLYGECIINLIIDRFDKGVCVWMFSWGDFKSCSEVLEKCVLEDNKSPTIHCSIPIQLWLYSGMNYNSITSNQVTFCFFLIEYLVSLQNLSV